MSIGQLISLQAAAERLDVDVSTLRRWISQGLITAYKVGPRSLRVSPGDVAALAQPLPTVRTGGAVK